MSSIIAEKVDQAIHILEELHIDAWLTFVRETTETGDTVLPLILGRPLTWQSALILTRRGDRIAIVGKYEDECVRSVGVWTEVLPYVQGISEPLRETLARLDPARLAVNYSCNDVKADGLSHGMYLLLREYLQNTPYDSRLVSAEGIIGALRGRKTPGEVDRIRQAIQTTDEIFDAVSGFAQPGVVETDISRFMHDQLRSRQLGAAWEMEQCPIVTTGPGSMVGHGLPSPDLAVREGCIFHLDFGVLQNEYCSDIQRAWYVPCDGEASPPGEVMQAFETVVAAINAAAAVLKPGVEGWQVDAAARQVVVDAGYPEYQHATGHHVGRSAHDGGGVLGPTWERYGRTPHYLLEPGNVVTLELGVDCPGDRGYLGLEEMVLVTDSGCEFLSSRQTHLPLLAIEQVREIAAQAARRGTHEERGKR